MKTAISATVICAVLVIINEPTLAQQDKKEASFKWVNPFPKGKYPGLHHGMFRSAAKSSTNPSPTWNSDISTSA